MDYSSICTTSKVNKLGHELGHTLPCQMFRDLIDNKPVNQTEIDRMYTVLVQRFHLYYESHRV